MNTVLNILTNPHETAREDSKRQNMPKTAYHWKNMQHLGQIILTGRSQFFTPHREDFWAYFTNPHGNPHGLFAGFSRGRKESSRILTGILTGAPKNPHGLHTLYRCVAVTIRLGAWGFVIAQGGGK